MNYDLLKLAINIIKEACTLLFTKEKLTLKQWAIVTFMFIFGSGIIFATIVFTAPS